MHFKKRTEKPAGSKGKQKRKTVRNQDLAVLRSQEPIMQRGDREAREQRKIDIKIDKLKTMESMDLVQKINNSGEMANTNSGKL